MTLDAVLAYLHYMAMFVLFAFLTAQAVMLRVPLDAHGIWLLGRTDIWYGVAALIAIATGLGRLYFGAKGAGFYQGQWPFWTKMAVFVALGLLSIKPTIEFIRWRRALQRGAAWRVPW